MPRPEPLVSFARRLLVALCLLLATACAFAQDWEWRAPLPQGNAVRDIAYGHGRYVAVGDAGTLLTASNGGDWRRLPAASHASLRAVAFGNGVFVAVGDGGAAVRSSDGEHWEAVDTGAEGTLYHVAHGAAGFVAAGGLELMVSPDGSDWTAIDHGIVPAGPFPPSFQGIAYGNGRYVVTLNTGPITPDVAKTLTSTDAAVWTLHDFAEPPEGDWGGGPVFFRGLVFGEGHFVAAAIRVSGNALTFRSADGVNWDWFQGPVHTLGAGLYLKSIDYDAANGRFVGIANPNDPPPNPDLFATVVESADGTAWTMQADITGLPLQPIRFAHDRLFAFTQQGEIHSSSDAATWTRVTAQAPAWLLHSVAANDHGVIAAGLGPAAEPMPLQEREGVVLESADGVDWTAAALPAAPDHVARQTNGAAASPSTFVVAAQETSGSIFDPPILRSNVLYVARNGAPWQRVDVAGLGEVNALTKVAYGGGMFLVTARDDSDRGVVLRSTDDGQTWQRFAATGATLAPGKAAHGDGGFVALPYGFGTKVLRSSDGVQWTEVETWPDSGGGILKDIAYAGGTYLIAGESAGSLRTNWLLRSTDGGATWQASEFPSHSIIALTGTASGFVLSAAGGDVLGSSDGVEWDVSWSGAQSPGPVAGDVEGRLWLATTTGGILERDAGAGQADLQLGVDGPETFARGTVVTFNVLVDNAGPASAAQPIVRLSADVPAANTAAAAPKGWSCAVQPARFYRASCTSGGAFDAGTHALFALRVTAAGKLFPPRIAVRASVASAAVDPAPGDNADALTARMVGAR